MDERPFVGHFERVSEERFLKDTKELFPYWTFGAGDVILPRRATAGSAGYDFFIPFDLVLRPGQSAVVPTGIRAVINDGWFLMLVPRSGLGTRYRMRLDNTAGIIDSDYSEAENEGHIMVKITNESLDDAVMSIEKGKAFVQGIFIPYGITSDDNALSRRKGGFGSTDKKE